MAQNAKLRDQTRENAQYLVALNQKLDTLTVRVAHIGETLAAIVSHLGEDVVMGKMQDLRVKRREAHDAELEQSVQFMLNEGLATKAADDAVIDANSFVVMDQVDPEGNVTRAQHELKRLDAEGQKRYFGKKVGDEITNPEVPGYKVVVKAIYTIDMAKVAEFAARKKAEAAAAKAVPATNP